MGGRHLILHSILNSVYIHSLLSEGYALKLTTEVLELGRECLKELLNLKTNSDFNFLQSSIVSNCKVWTPAAYVNAMSIVSFNVKSFNDNWLTGDNFRKKLTTLLTSHTAEYRGCDGLKTKIPFMYRTTKG